MYPVQLRSEQSISDSPEIKAEYLSCLRSLYLSIRKGAARQAGEEKELQEEIRRVEDEISNAGKTWIFNITFLNMIQLKLHHQRLFWYSRAEGFF